MAKQIKSKKRVVDYGEVYTNKREVNAMLDLVSEEASNITSTFLEPACGNGNFIIEILKRKMITVKSISSSPWDLAINTLKALSTVYGVDIQEDNVEECRVRVSKYLMDTLGESLCRYSPVFYKQWFSIVNEILSYNLICGNMLTGTTASGSDLQFSEWLIHNNGRVIRKDQLFSDILLGEANYVDEISYRMLCDISLQTFA